MEAIEVNTEEMLMEVVPFTPKKITAEELIMEFYHYPCELDCQKCEFKNFCHEVNNYVAENDLLEGI